MAGSEEGGRRATRPRGVRWGCGGRAEGIAGCWRAAGRRWSAGTWRARGRPTAAGLGWLHEGRGENSAGLL